MDYFGKNLPVARNRRPWVILNTKSKLFAPGSAESKLSKAEISLATCFCGSPRPGFHGRISTEERRCTKKRSRRRSRSHSPSIIPCRMNRNSFSTWVRIAIAAFFAAGKALPAPDRDRAAQSADLRRGSLPIEPADDGSRSRDTWTPTFRTNQLHKKRPV